MALTVKSIRGTRDILPDQTHKWQYVENIAAQVAGSIGAHELRFPTIEKTQLFTRSVGETTDVVQKEMYTFDKGRESITLRPEGTAGAVRAVLENSLLNDALPLKIYYNISCFRHENPQAGRFREFRQFGVECFGSKSPAADAELISVANDILQKLGINEVALAINSIGCPQCRPGYNERLVQYYTERHDELCDTCKERLEKNPLRLLDCKNEQCAAIAKTAPIILDNLCTECEEHFAGVKARLDAMEIAYNVNPYIVRGLDYYTKTVFEFISQNIGAQGTICGGGRYDLLVEQMGGANTPALGFAMGLDRLLMVMQAHNCNFPERKVCDIYIGSMGVQENVMAQVLATQLHRRGITAVTDCMGRSVKAQMKFADKIGATYSCIIGSRELEDGTISLKQMDSGVATTVPLSVTGLCPNPLGAAQTRKLF